MSQRRDRGPHTISTGTGSLAYLITVRAYATRPASTLGNIKEKIYRESED